MTFEQIQHLHQTQSEFSLPFPIKKRRRIKGLVSVNDFVPIPVENVASFYDRGVDIPIKDKMVMKLATYSSPKAMKLKT